jgi:hypothetical protein
MKIIAKLFALLLLGIVVLSLTGNAIPRISQLNQPPSDLLTFLFQILFWLFFISPPLIVLLLFLIWRELKERNRMK